MSDDDRLNLVERMRKAQRQYSRSRDLEVLAECKRLETEVDEMLEERRRGPALFAPPREEG